MIIKVDNKTICEIPMYLNSVMAGFPSPAEDHLDKPLDLNEHLIERPNSTFIVKASGDSMVGCGIYPGTYLIVDKSLSPRNNDLVIAVINSDFLVKRFTTISGKPVLLSENEKYKPIFIESIEDFYVWGIVISFINKCR